MNRTCDEQQFKVDESWYWRCLGYGDIIEIESPLKEGAECSRCKRPVAPSTVEVDTRVKITKQICFKTNRYWLDFKDMILPG